MFYSEVKHSVFIKTFKDDLKWLAWCFRFLKHNWLTDSEFVVSAPADCTDSLKGLQELLGHAINIVTIEQWPFGFTHQQYVKMCADQYCQGNHITFIDSDVMLIKPTVLEKNLLVGEKPLIWYTSYANLPGVPWHHAVTRVLSLQPEYEFMRCFPITYHRSTLKSCRDHIEAMHGRTLAEFMSKEATRWGEWSEFNIIGFYAYIFERERYEWRDTYAHPESYGPIADGQSYRHDRVRQFFSRGDWHSGTVPYLTEIANKCGFTVEESPVDTEAIRVVKTPPKGQQNLIEKILPSIFPGHIAIDVGAHEGLHSLAYAKAGARVYAFEPCPVSFMKLWRTLYAEARHSVAMPLAISDKEGTTFFHEDKDCLEASYSSHKRTTETAAIGEEIPTESLDNFFMYPMSKVPLYGSEDDVCLIKIDIEGFEPLVLQGAKELIETYRPVIVVECEKAALERNGFTKADILDFLTERGYEIEISTTDPRASTNEEDYFYDVISRPSRRDDRTDGRRDLGDQRGDALESVGPGSEEIGSRPGLDTASIELHPAEKLGD